MSDGSMVAPATISPRTLKYAGLATGAIAALIVTTGWISRSHEVAQAEGFSRSVAIPAVHLVTARTGTAGGTLDLPGTTAAWADAHLYPRVNGYVRDWSHDIGDRVSAGTPLGRIDTPELDQQIVHARADLASARAGLRLAQSTAARWRDLLTTNSVSRQETDEKEADLAVRNAAVSGAAAELARLMAMKSFATVRAPFAGIVTQRAADVGDLVGPSSAARAPLFSIADTHRIRIYVDVPQRFAGAMKGGRAASLTVPDRPGESFSARVAGNAGAVDPASGTMKTQLVVENADRRLRPGEYATVRFAALDTGAATVLPSDTLISGGNGMTVATVGANGRVHLVPVTIGRDMGATVEIANGLRPGMQVVENPPDSLADGDLVRVVAVSHG